MMSSLKMLTFLSDALGKRDALPGHLEIARVGSLSIANSFDEVDSAIICNSIMTGIDKDLHTAILKSFSEYFERRAFEEGFLSCNPFCQTDRSDGFAAYPKACVEFEKLAKENALNEAIERYVWSTWWDDLEIQCDVFEKNADDKNFWGESVYLLNEVADLFEIKNIKTALPRFSQFTDKELIIVFCEIEDGVISGGACGSIKDRDQTILKAIGELARHALALSKIKSKSLTPKSFYEKRLAFFSEKRGFDIYKKRLNINGPRFVQFPKLVIDDEISHKFSDLFYVHRCLFENQPPFVGGPLERLCL